MTTPPMQDFSRPKAEKKPKEIKFKIDDDVFEAYPEIGGDLLMQVVASEDLKDLVDLDLDDLSQTEQLKLARTINNQMARAVQFMDLVLLPDSAQRFGERMRSTTEPITLAQAVQVWRWLIQQYGGNPTEPSSPSANGHDGTGESSTATAPSEA